MRGALASGKWQKMRRAGRKARPIFFFKLRPQAGEYIPLVPAPLRLTYAAAVPSVERRHNGLTISVPGHSHSWTFYLWISLTLGVAGLCLMATFWPSGVTATPIGDITHPGGIGARVFCFLFAVLLIAAVRDRRLKARHGATITLCGTSIILTTPGLWVATKA